LLAVALMYPATRTRETDKPVLRLVALLPLIAIVLLFSVQTIRRNSDWRDTEALFNRTLLANPRSLDAYLALGAVKDASNDFDGAIKMYREALEVSRDHYRVLYNLGVTYKKKGWIREATRALERSRDANPEFLVTRVNLALAYHEQKRYVEAIAENKEALRLAPDYAPSRGSLGRIYLETGKPDLALVELNRALEIQPNLAPGLTDRAGILMSRGRVDEAERDLRRLESLGVDTRRLRAKLEAERSREQ
jgi:tetratricopeptide (TPR) repeat protein